ncbi:MAG: ABC transporter permease [Thermoleophilia bacterium]|nr:ABC transporter permease [Thermoleophilia bacterium]
MRRSLRQIDHLTGKLVLAGEVVLLLVLWQVLVGGMEVVNPTFFPPPLDTLEGFEGLFASGELGGHVLVSVKAWMAGYALVLAVGIPAGLLIGTSLPVDKLAMPWVWTLYATPLLAYQPLAKAWFGFGIGPIIFLVFIGSLFPLLFNTAAGIRTVSRSLVNAGRIFGASKRELYGKVLLPATLPYIMAGARQSAVIATISLMVAEMTTTPEGMGSLIVFTANQYRTEESFAAIVMVVVWSLTMTALIGWLGRRLAPWTAGGERG